MNEHHKRQKISAFVICFNEEQKIRRCLESVRWCDEIIIVDSGSTDATLSICRDFTDKIFSRTWPGHVEQKRYALSLCTHEWILNIDADEVVDDQLREEIQQVLHADSGNDINGYYVNRVVFYLDKWWRKGGWYPEYRLRVCRRSATSWGGENPHEKAIVSGKTGRLRGELQHYTYENVSSQIETINSFSSSAALSLWKSGERHSLAKIFLRPLARFLKFYIVRKGFREGFEGLIVAILEAYYVFLKYVKLWEIARSNRNEPLP